MPCRINVCSGRKGGRSPRENPPKGDFVGFSHGDISTRQAKIRQIVAENATHGMSRSFVWRGERSPCENTKKSPFGGYSRGDLSRFRPENTIIRHGTNQPLYLDILFLTFFRSVLSTRQAIMPFRLVKSDTSLTFRSTCVDLWRTCQGEQNPLCNIRRRKKYPRGKVEREEMSGW